MSIPPKRVSSAGIIDGSADVGRETMPTQPDCERVPGSGITAGVTDAGWDTMSIPSDRTHILGAGVAAGDPGSDRETMPIPSDANACLVTAVTPATFSLCGFMLAMVIWSRCVFSRRAQVATCHRVPRVGSFSIARPPRSTGPPPVGSA